MKGQEPSANSRQRVLARIREALQDLREPRAAAETRDFSPAAPAGQFLPAAPPSPDAQWQQFEENLRRLGGTMIRCQSEEDAARALTEMALAEGWRQVATHDAASLRPLQESLRQAGCHLHRPEAGAELMAACEAALTTCRCAVAQFGSLMVDSAGEGGRALTVVAPHHVVVVRPDQIVPDMPSALAQVERGSRSPSMVGLITGPSRTGDIERILVMGAHGPRRLTVLRIPAGEGGASPAFLPPDPV